MSHRGLHKPRHFYGISPLGTMSDHNWWIFHLRGDLSILADIRHIFSFIISINRATLLNVVPYTELTQSNTKRSVDSLTMHSHSFNAISLCICNAICHCLFVPCHIYDECYMDNIIKHAYHQCILSNYIKHAYHFPTLTHLCQCIRQAYINITYKSLLSQVMKQFIL